MWDTWNVTWINKDFEERELKANILGILKSWWILLLFCVIHVWSSLPRLKENGFPQGMSHHWRRNRSSKAIILWGGVAKRLNIEDRWRGRGRQTGRQGCRKGKMSASWKWELHTGEEEMKVSTLNPWFVFCGPERFGV